MTIQDMYDSLGQAHTLKLISAEQFNALVAGIEHEGWRDVVEYCFLELAKHVEDRHIRAMGSTAPKTKNSAYWKSKYRSVKLVSEDGGNGTFRCSKCSNERVIGRTIIGQWPLGTWKCPNGCK